MRGVNAFGARSGRGAAASLIVDGEGTLLLTVSDRSCPVLIERGRRIGALGVTRWCSESEVLCVISCRAPKRCCLLRRRKASRQKSAQKSRAPSWLSNHRRYEWALSTGRSPSSRCFDRPRRRRAGWRACYRGRTREHNADPPNRRRSATQRYPASTSPPPLPHSYTLRSTAEFRWDNTHSPNWR